LELPTWQQHEQQQQRVKAQQTSNVPIIASEAEQGCGTTRLHNYAVLLERGD
jgi:hypothetical protein